VGFPRRLNHGPPAGRSHSLPTRSIDIIKKQSGEMWASLADEASLAGRIHCLRTHSIDIIKRQSGELWASRGG
jgi:hypothetical protein